MISKKKYSVCHVVYENYPRDPRVRRYINALIDADINSIIICSRGKNEKYFDEINGSLVYRIPVSKKRTTFFATLIEYLLFTNISCILLVYLGIKYNFRIIHIHTLPDFLVFAAFLNKIFGAKVILDMHEIFPELYIARTGAHENSFKVKLLMTAERWSIGFADEIITIHDNAKEIIVLRNKTSENKIDVVMNSVDPTEYSSFNNYIADISLPDSKYFIITYNGTVVKLLNLTMIVEALALLKNKMPVADFERLIFNVYGDGPALEEILSTAERLGVSNIVRYMGYKQPEEMRKEVLKTSVVILPPLKNIYSDLFYTIKLIEAVYLKIPVIATRLKTYKQYYGEDSLFYFESGNLNDLCRKIEEVFYNKELVRKKTTNAYNDYKKVSWNVMSERYMNIINKFIT